MIKGAVKFIHSFRIFFLSFIVVYFLVLLGLNPVDLGRFFGAHLGSAIGMSTGVQENPFNKLALQLNEKEDKLNIREIELIQQERRLLDESTSKQERLLELIAIGIVFLFILVLLNFFFDYKRGMYKNSKK